MEFVTYIMVILYITVMKLGLYFVESDRWDRVFSMLMRWSYEWNANILCTKKYFKCYKTSNKSVNKNKKTENAE